MKRLIVSLLFFMASLSLAVTIPQELLFQGKLKSAAGSPVKDGVYTITFRLYDAATGGTKLWEETQDVSVAGGNFTVELGSKIAFNLPFDQAYWLEMQVSGDTPMTPRKPLKASPYAFKAENTDMVDGLHASSTPKANMLFPLDSSGKIPTSVLPSNLSGTFIEKSPSAAQTIFPTGDFTGLILKGQGVSDATTNAFTGQTTPWFEIQDKNGLSLFSVDPVAQGLFCPQGCAFEGLDEIINDSQYFSAELGDGTTDAFMDVFNTNPSFKVHLGVGGEVKAEYLTAEITDSASTIPLIWGNNQGSGDLLVLQQGGVDKFVIDSSGNIVVGGSGGVLGPINGTNSAPSGYAGSFVNTGSGNPDPSFYATNQAGGPAGEFSILDSVSSAPALDVNSVGTGAALDVSTTGQGEAGIFAVANPASISASLYVTNNGGGNGIESYVTGTGEAGDFDIANTSSSSAALSTKTTGLGPALDAWNAGMGPAADFSITDPTNSSVLIGGNSDGIGNLLELWQAGTNKFVVTNAGEVLIGNPTIQAAAISVLETGTVNYAGRFEINNNTSSTPLLVGNHAGNGELLLLQQGGASKFIVDSMGNLDLAGNISKISPLFQIDVRDAGVSVLDMVNSSSGLVELQVNGQYVPVTDGVSPQRIQSGTFAATCGIADTTTAVSFPLAFGSTPIVTVTPMDSGTVGGRRYVIDPFSLSSTGFTLICGGFSGSVSFNWIAIGSK